MRTRALTTSERRFADALRTLLRGVAWLQDWTVASAEDGAWDLYASGPISGGKALLCVECKNNFTPSQFPGLASRPCQRRGFKASAKVLAVPQMSPRLAELCKTAGWSWFDLAGNCRLEVAGALSIERSGKKLTGPPIRARANLGTLEASRVIRALLVPEHAGRRWTQREMVEHFWRLDPPFTAPSLALVNKVFQHLRDQAYVETLEKERGIRVRDYEGLLKAWRDAYRFDRYDRFTFFTLLKGKTLEERLRAIDVQSVGDLAYASFSAADFQAPVVRQPRTWLYLGPLHREAVERFEAAIDAKLVESGENVVVFVTSDDAIFYQSEAGRDRLPATNVLQTYLDLLHLGGRGEEAAEAILERRLRPVWAAAAR